jgi:DNA polymerase-3 subunit gamma/tau
VDANLLADYYTEICKRENVGIDEEAAALIARAADGSVRDGMSLLDQAMALGDDDITGEQIQDMLGLADHAKILDVFEYALKGECAKSLSIMDELYRSGADPATLLKDMLDYCHILTRLRALPDVDEIKGAMSPDMKERAIELSGHLSMPSLGRAWQILLKGIGEINFAPNPQAAAEMVIIRLNYAADLPDPGSLLRKLKKNDAASENIAANEGGSAPDTAAATSAATDATATAATENDTTLPSHSSAAQVGSIDNGAQMHPDARQVTETGYGANGATTANVKAAAIATAAPEMEIYEDIDALSKTHIEIKCWEDVIEALKRKKEVILGGQLYHYVHLVKMSPGALELRLEPEADTSLSQNLRKFLIDYTGNQWMVSVSGAEGQPTLAQIDEEMEHKEMESAMNNPVVKEVMEIFPNSDIKIAKNG